MVRHACTFKAFAAMDAMLMLDRQLNPVPSRPYYEGFKLLQIVRYPC